jgi:hypothetical protein
MSAVERSALRLEQSDWVVVHRFSDSLLAVHEREKAVLLVVPIYASGLNALDRLLSRVVQSPALLSWVKAGADLEVWGWSPISVGTTSPSRRPVRLESFETPADDLEDDEDT